MTLAKTEADQNLRKAELTLAQVRENLEITRLNREVVELALEEATAVAVEAAFLYDRGELSQLEWEEAQLGEKEARADLFKALADEYAAWLALRLYL